jgi:hypothetical protein
MKHVLFLLIVAIMLSGQSFVSAEDTQKNKQCLTNELSRIKMLTKREYLLTLDGRYLSLEELFAVCRSSLGLCGLYEKFYYWHNEVREIVSKGQRGPVRHKIRAYFNSMTTCYRVGRDPLKIYGDVAEFYNENGVFMGFAVYKGGGVYAGFPFKKSCPKY